MSHRDAAFKWNGMMHDLNPQKELQNQLHRNLSIVAEGFRSKIYRYIKLDFITKQLEK